MYRAFFGLSKLPFKSSPDLDVFYKNGSRQDILEALVYTVVRGDGITKVTGEVGSGKTMLLRLLADSLPDNFTVLYINTPNLSPKDMLMHIAAELGLDLDRAILKFSLLEWINKELVRLYSKGQRVVMLIDEAQAMTFDTLEEIRLLSNLETSEGKLLQVVLFGQPELDIALSNNNVRQLKSRISYSIFIPPLSPEEVCSYLNYRMRRADFEGLDVFELTVSKKIHQLSEGIPRTINTIADKLLMSAYSLEDTKVTKKHIAMLPKDVLAGGMRREGRFYLLLLLMFMSVVGGILYFILMSPALTLSLSSENVPLELPSSEENTAISQGAELNSTLSLNQKNQSTSPLSSADELKAENLDLLPSDSDFLGSMIPIKQSLNRYSYAENGVESPVKSDDEAYFRVNGSLLSNRLLQLHFNTVEWLMQMPAQMYVIQLASPHVSTLEEAMLFYREQNISMDSIHLLIDLGRSSLINRFRVLYLASASYSTLERVISELPSEIMKSSPYIVTVGGVLKNMQYTQNSLKQNGIVNVTQ
ncbi:MAG: AAA family ATPase [Thiomicrorhabdus sp.]|nr:AAA family ATPase [Thiomicrorhabdus sp.]